jgi:hypothetical protein
VRATSRTAGGSEYYNGICMVYSTVSTVSN